MIGIRAPIADVYAALTSVKGLSSWWTSDTGGEPSHKGGVIEFRFGGHGPGMEVLTLTPNASVEWRCVAHAENAAEWIGTRITFALKSDKDKVIVRFRHGDWKDASDFLAFCSMKWATFLLSLRESLETGAGRPYPHDLQIT